MKCLLPHSQVGLAPRTQDGFEKVIKLNRSSGRAVTIRGGGRTHRRGQRPGGRANVRAALGALSLRTQPRSV